ncbi:MAG: dockerin type I repeat-containing protein [Clostridia bacterium]|nr:dockerin type I repeat-containing protein [Clostridia bacterium]
MKKTFAFITAVMLLFATIPVLAFTGHTTAPEMPSVSTTNNQFFPIEVNRKDSYYDAVEEFGQTTYTFYPEDNNAPIAVGDTVVFECSFEVPAAISGFTAEELESIEVSFDFVDLSNLTLITASGLVGNSYCDYDNGYCYQTPGYANGHVEGTKLSIDAQLNTTVSVYVEGVATSTNVNCANSVIIGQYKLPTHFSVGKLVKEDDYYYAYYKDTVNVQIRGMKFFENNGKFDHYYVCLNEHDYVRSKVGSSYRYTEVGNSSNVITSGTKFDALQNAYNTYMSFFGFTDNSVQDTLTDSVFIYNYSPVKYAQAFAFGAVGSVPGDIDGDGALKFDDVTLLYFYLLNDNSGSFSPESLGCADLNNDGVISIADITLMYNLMLGD